MLPAEEFACALKAVLEIFQTSLQKCYKWKEDLFAQIDDANRQILNEAVRLKTLIDSHSNILSQKLTSIKGGKLEEIESMKQDVERFKGAIEGYAKYSEALLSN